MKSIEKLYLVVLEEKQRAVDWLADHPADEKERMKVTGMIEALSGIADHIKFVQQRENEPILYLSEK